MTIREYLTAYWDMITCWLATSHAQQDGSAFCRCAWRMYPMNAETLEIFHRPLKKTRA